MKNLIISPNHSIKNAMKKIDLNGHRAILVVGKNNKLLGTLTDGDIRKYLINNNNIKNSIKNIYQKEFFSLNKNEIFKHDLDELVLQYSLIPIINKSNKLIEILTRNNFKDYFNNKAKSEYTGFILAGGKGIRMGSLSKVIPKPLIMIDNLPLIEIIYKYLRQYSINNIFISLNYKKEMIKSFFIEKNLM